MNDKLTIELYKDIAPAGTVDLIKRLVEKLQGKSVLHVNSTRLGGGVAEMLLRLVPMFNELGVKSNWDVVKGSDLFYKTTKCFHNALQGDEQNITADMYEEYLRVNRENADNMNFNDDIIVIHDPQPAAFIKNRNNSSKWIWRCHIDISRPQRKVWQFLKEFVNSYDAAIFSLPKFAQNINIPQFLIYPSIDPLSDKNKEISRKEINQVLKKFNIPMDKPIILQVSRFDKFKDPIGVIKAYQMVKKFNDCYLILAGGGASDDPEGQEVLNRVYEEASHDKDIYVLDLPPDANIEINALQRSASVVLQKSTKEGFGLTVAEAMWKGKPVIGGAVGGIATQIVYGITGFTVNSIEGCAYRIRYLLNNPVIAKKIGKDAKEYTRRNFLITRHMLDYIALMYSVLNGK
ncbi:MAG: glycosyltransferase [Candidatus Kaelpia imicola]|nr:glycosyltransferase [Candidatus Kaelpia imicola]